MKKDLVLRFITMPMAITVFKQDKKHFKVSKVNVLFYDLIDSVLAKMEQDFRQMKADMYKKHHLDVRYLGEGNGLVNYRVNQKMISFTPAELKEQTEKLMKEYMVNVEVVRKNRIWDD